MQVKNLVNATRAEAAARAILVVAGHVAKVRNDLMEKNYWGINVDLL